MTIETNMIGNGSQENEKAVRNVIDQLRKSVEIRKNLKRLSGFAFI
jgi:hypothetical protein